MLAENTARAYETTYSASERKLSGTHYTPDDVIGYIIEKTICVDVAASTLLQYKILDPACGTGLFLLKAFEAICAAFRRKQGVLIPQQARAILENCIYGIDIDAAAIRETQKNLLIKAKELGVQSAEIRKNFFAGDALDLLTGQQQQMDFDFDNGYAKTIIFPEVMTQGGFDYVIGNPPYIRIQNIFPTERRNRYINFFRTATGRFDISVLFIELATRFLREKGKLGFIVSNKFLSTNGAKQLRQFIIDNFTVEEIVDLADTKLFEAAVLPMILILQRGRGLFEQMLFSVATETKSSSPNSKKNDSIFEILRENQLPFACEAKIGTRIFNIQKFISPQPQRTNSIWTFHSPTETKILEKIKCATKGTLSDFAEKISVGLKTTADEVFIKPMTKAFIDQMGFERELVLPVLESHNIQRWKIHWDLEKDNHVLYPHQYSNERLLPVNLSRFPQVKKYLYSHRNQLAGRTYLKESGRQWYEIWVHQSPRDFEKIKIITPDISAVNRFGLDQNGYFVNGTCFYIILKNQSLELNFAILALLNSRLIEYFHKTTSGNALYAKRFRYWATHLSRYPIPKAFEEASVLERLTQYARTLQGLSITHEIKKVETENDRLIFELFGLNDSDIDEVEITLRINRAA